MSSSVSLHAKGFVAGLVYCFCNYFIANIPSWHVRKLLYRLCGMKIGKHSRIMMKVTVTHPWNIVIGSNTTVNEFCYLDGRGGLRLGDQVNIALYSALVTGFHVGASCSFEYLTEPILIEDDVWVAVRATILNGCTLKKGCIVAAGSVVSPGTVCDAWSVWGGVPSKRIKSRDLDGALEIAWWRIHLR